MSSLFIDTLSSPDFICLFDSEKNIIDSISWEGRHAEFDTLTESIDILLDRNALSYSDLANITCIV
jgi:tRNA A37 threonylcarbamoyladenosine modification protein TsaB